MALQGNSSRTSFRSWLILLNQSSFKKYLTCLKQAPIMSVGPPTRLLSPQQHATSFIKWRGTALSRNQQGEAIKEELRVCRQKLDMIPDTYCKCHHYYAVVVSRSSSPFSGVTARCPPDLMKPSQQPGPRRAGWWALLSSFTCSSY